MKSIHIDINHPANVHYFKHTIANLKAKGFEIIITCRNKEITYELLTLEGLEYIPMGKNPTSLFMKLLFLFKCEWKIFKLYLKKKPDIAMSSGAIYVSHMAYFFGFPHVVLEDTEHAKLNRALHKPFTDLILNPESFFLDLGHKQYKYKGHMELFYLNEKYFSPDIKIFSELGIPENSPFIFLRFVSWGALHDYGQMGFSDEYKLSLVNELSKDYRVFISAEGALPPTLQPYHIRVKPNRIHHVLSFASLFIGEGATMASECAALGTPAIYVNSLDVGTLQSQAKDGLIINKRYQDGTLEKAHEILNDPEYKIRLKEKVKSLNRERYNLTDFLTWLVSEYPESKQKLLSGEIDPKKVF
jgi:predicted glycosyltransferase